MFVREIKDGMRTGWEKSQHYSEHCGASMANRHFITPYAVKRQCLLGKRQRDRLQGIDPSYRRKCKGRKLWNGCKMRGVNVRKGWTEQYYHACITETLFNIVPNKIWNRRRKRGSQTLSLDVVVERDIVADGGKKNNRLFVRHAHWLARQSVPRPARRYHPEIVKLLAFDNSTFIERLYRWSLKKTR